MIFSNGLSTASGPSVFGFGGRPFQNLVGLGVGAVALEADGVGRPVNAVVAVLTLGRLCDDDAREHGHAPCPSPCGGLEPSKHAAPTPPVVVQECSRVLCGPTPVSIPKRGRHNEDMHAFMEVRKTTALI